MIATGNSRSFVANRRCIYTGVLLDTSKPETAPSREHIIPLSLGGSNQFTVHDVSREANNIAGKKIDDEVSSHLIFLMLRNRFGLSGHRGTVPSVDLHGVFDDIGAEAKLSIDPDSTLRVKFKKEQEVSDAKVVIKTDEVRMRELLGYRLVQANRNSNYLKTPLGDIKDQEDIDIFLEIAEREGAGTFRHGFSINLRDFQTSLQHFAIKIALCLGHQQIGAEWTFGPDGNLLRKALFPQNFKSIPKINGSMQSDLNKTMHEMLCLRDDQHSIAFLRHGNIATAMIALFGGRFGVWTVCLSKKAKKYRKGKLRNQHEGQLFCIPIDSDEKKRILTTMSLNQAPCL